MTDTLILERKFKYSSKDSLAGPLWPTGPILVTSALDDGTVSMTQLSYLSVIHDPKPDFIHIFVWGVCMWGVFHVQKIISCTILYEPVDLSHKNTRPHPEMTLTLRQNTAL